MPVVGPPTVAKEPFTSEGSRTAPGSRSGPVHGKSSPIGGAFASLMGGLSEETDDGTPDLASAGINQALDTNVDDPEPVKDASPSYLLLFLAQDGCQQLIRPEEPVGQAEIPDLTAQTSVTKPNLTGVAPAPANLEEHAAGYKADTNWQAPSGTQRKVIPALVDSTKMVASSHTVQPAWQSPVDLPRNSTDHSQAVRSDAILIRDVPVAMVALGASGDARSFERGPAREPLKALVPGGDGGWGSGFSPTSAATQAYGTPTEATSVTADAVEEQVTYWVNQELQSAELTLDGLGHDPIQVSISLQGTEANIAFRTDQLATRNMLESSAGSLQELLARHGLSLGGVTVGTSGGGGHQQEKDQHLASGRKLTFQVGSAANSTDAGSRQRVSERAIDLFV